MKQQATEADPVQIFRRLLNIGRREKRSKLMPNVRLADPNLVRHRHRHYRENVTAEECERRKKNWKRSKVGRADARKRRRAHFKTKTAAQIRTEHWARKVEQLNRRIVAARALWKAFDPDKDLLVINVVDDSKGLEGTLIFKDSGSE